MTSAPGELFELELFGEGIERRYRKMRPEVAAMPWGTMSLEGISQAALVRARARWTSAAFQEHRTGIACAATLRLLYECRAPVDLIALASRFPLDEVVHVELCARMAMELGGGTEIRHDPDAMIVDPARDLSPLMRAADAIVRFFCVGEAVSIPLLRGAWHAARHPLPRAVLGRIVRDEAAHGTFGFAFLDWALPRLPADDVAGVCATYPSAHGGGCSCSAASDRFGPWETVVAAALLVVALARRRHRRRAGGNCNYVLRFTTEMRGRDRNSFRRPSAGM